jgi:hypothetical protein
MGRYLEIPEGLVEGYGKVRRLGERSVYHVGRGFSTIHGSSPDFQAKDDHARAEDKNLSPEGPPWQHPRCYKISYRTGKRRYPLPG